MLPTMRTRTTSSLTPTDNHDVFVRTVGQPKSASRTQTSCNPWEQPSRGAIHVKWSSLESRGSRTSSWKQMILSGCVPPHFLRSWRDSTAWSHLHFSSPSVCWTALSSAPRWSAWKCRSMHTQTTKPTTGCMCRVLCSCDHLLTSTASFLDESRIHKREDAKAEGQKAISLATRSVRLRSLMVVLMTHHRA